MGSKGSNTTTTNQSQTYEANPLVAGAGQQALSMAQGAASQPFQMSAAPVAGFNPDQQQAFQLFRDAQGSAQPYINQAYGAYDASRAPITAQDVNQYYNPMVDSVTANLKDIFGQQNQQNQGRLTAQAGGVGADRIAVGMANLGKEQGLAAGQTYSQLYQQALQQAQQQKQMQAGAASGFAGLGTQALTTNLQGAGALAGSGQAQQQQSQAELNSPYQLELARLAYPFQTAQYLAGITGGLAPTFGGTTTGQSQVTKPSPSLLSQLFGAGTAAAGMFGSSGGFGKGSTSGTGDGSWYGPSSVGGAPLSGYAEGGAAEEDLSSDPIKPPTSIVPEIQMTPGAGHSAPLTGAMNMQQPQESGGKESEGPGVADIAKLAMMFLKRGGKVPRFDDGGGTFDDRFGAAYAGQGPASFKERFAPAEPLIPQMKGPYDVNHLLTPHEQAIDAYRMASTDPVRLDKGQADIPEEAEPALGNMNSRPNDPVRSYMAPQDQMPYPDATQRDWGQRATRSPWMSLVHAGAAMMSTPGTFGEALGAGLKAGAKSVEEQRKDLRSEEEINNKARTLYQSARQHLDQYTKMTPYQREALRLRNKGLDQEDREGTALDFKPSEISAAIKAVKEDPMNIGKSQEELRALVAKELAMRKALRGNGDIPATAPAGDGSSSGTALPDPGAAGRVKGKWYIGPSGSPQQWLG